MKKLLLLLSLFMLCGCGSSGYKSVQDTLSEMKNYRANVDVTYFFNKGQTTYNMDICAIDDGRYRMDIHTPKEFENYCVLYDGNLIWQYNPNLPNNKISIAPPDKQSRREILLFSFMKNYLATDKVGVSTASMEESKCTVLEANIIGGNKLFSKVKLWVDNETKLPKQLIVYSADNKQIIVENFNKCVYNTEIDRNYFVLNK